MITIDMYRRPGKVSDEELTRIEKELPLLVSGMFHPAWTDISGKSVTERESQVMILAHDLYHDFGSLDVNTPDLYISVKAGFPEYFKGNADSDREELVKGVREIINRVISVRKGFPSYIICRVELNLICSSSEEIQSKEVILFK
jgi:hypothetical protein